MPDFARAFMSRFALQKYCIGSILRDLILKKRDLWGATKFLANMDKYSRRAQLCVLLEYLSKLLAKRLPEPISSRFTLNDFTLHTFFGLRKFCPTHTFLPPLPS
jgi:hypothetical protein